MREIFLEGNFTEVTICFIVGYDAIGYGGHVVCSLDLPPILQDTRELISLLIHELTLVIHAQYCPAIRDLSLQKETLQETLDLLIQYEGVAVFSAYPYRVASGILQNTEGAMLQDYVNTPEKEQMLKDAYCRSQRYIAEGRGMDTILETYFSARVDHALGFIIFHNMFKQ
ncbi:MAG: hypothetical protein GX033_08855 [Firmicutes bacterium]|nr:hypothetical protein [Bacillota bacterium]